MLKSYCKDIDIIEFKDKKYIKSRCIDTVKPNILTLEKQKILIYYFYDLENHKVDIKNTSTFEEVCRKLCLTKGQALNFLRLKEILQDYETGSKKAKATKIWRPGTIISVRAVHTITGEVVKVNTVRELSRIISVSETSIRKAINQNLIVKNWKIIARHKDQN